MLEKITKAVRVITVAPFMALAMLLILYINEPAFFAGEVNYILSVFFLTVLPLSAYPLQRYFKKYRDKGRDGQRSLAIIFAVVGYVLGLAFALTFSAPMKVCIIFISYLLSGALVLAINKLLHYKASGHACGIAGPSLLLIYFGQPCGYLGAAVLAVAWLSSLYMKRHTTMQFLTGQLIPVLSIGIVVLINAII